LISPLKAPHCVFCILGCYLLFELWSFLFFLGSFFYILNSLVPWWVYFLIFIFILNLGMSLRLQNPCEMEEVVTQGSPWFLLQENRMRENWSGSHLATHSSSCTANQLWGRMGSPCLHIWSSMKHNEFIHTHASLLATHL
jgi:hypothetical protein